MEVCISHHWFDKWLVCESFIHFVLPQYVAYTTIQRIIHKQNCPELLTQLSGMFGMWEHGFAVVNDVICT
jgi:hypothetical protein